MGSTDQMGNVQAQRNQAVQSSPYAPLRNCHISDFSVPYKQGEAVVHTSQFSSNASMVSEVVEIEIICCKVDRDGPMGAKWRWRHPPRPITSLVLGGTNLHVRRP